MPDLERAGARIHYDVHGAVSSRLPLLLTHGYGGSAQMWQQNLAALSADHQVITWDIRGHGRSSAPDDASCYSQDESVADMAAILDACGAERALVGGLSLGGYLSLAFRLAHPDRVAALLLFDTGPGFKKDEARDGWNTYAEKVAARFRRDGVTESSGSSAYRGGSDDAEGLALAALGILRQRDASVIESLPTIAVPTLVLVGADDTRFLAAADYMVAKIPDATHAVIADAGHEANIDQPEQFDAAVVAFLDANA
jgi:pimeloyl-ACP methyl ester carboxylesterase